MSKGIVNFQIENALKNLNDEDINDNFVGVLPANQMNRFVDYKTMVSQKKGKYPFVVANIVSSDKAALIGRASWILSLELIFFFYSFGVDGLKSFIMQDDKKAIEKILLVTEQLTKTDNKITLVNINLL